MLLSELLVCAFQNNFGYTVDPPLDYFAFVRPVFKPPYKFYLSLITLSIVISCVARALKTQQLTSCRIPFLAKTIYLIRLCDLFVLARYKNISKTCV